VSTTQPTFPEKLSTTFSYCEFWNQSPTWIRPLASEAQFSGVLSSQRCTRVTDPKLLKKKHL
jgi:hypothetical protein